MGKEYVAPMHTAEHVLNGVMVRQIGCNRCFSAHINAKKSKCDYRLDRPLTQAEADTIEASVNEQLARQLDVVDEVISVVEASKDYDLGRLPEGVDTVRIVHIGDFDSCPCIGKHVSNTREVGHFCLTTHSWNDGVLRLRFKLKSV